MFKPCPFCGSANLESGGDDKIVAVRCRDCEATGPNHYGSRAEWNTRSLHRTEPQTAPGDRRSQAKELAEWIIGYLVNECALDEGCVAPSDRDNVANAVLNHITGFVPNDLLDAADELLNKPGIARIRIKSQGHNLLDREEVFRRLVRARKAASKADANAPADAERLALAERIEAWMRDHASAGEGAVFDLCPDHQLLVISALRTESSCLSEQEKSAVKNLRNHQDQCDADGVMVKVSRQALDETLAAIDRLIKAGNPLIVSSLRAGGWREDMENAPRKNWERLDLLSVAFDGYSERTTRHTDAFWLDGEWCDNGTNRIEWDRKDADTGVVLAYRKITHWMLLPSAPKNTDKEG